MVYTIRKTHFSDVEYLGDVERSANETFKFMPELAWIAESDVASAQLHSQFVNAGLSWIAFDPESHAILGFILSEIIEDDMYIAEVSVSALHQKKGIGTNLLETAFTEAKVLGVKVVTLTTFIDVPWNAPYYKRLGFAILPDENIPSYLQQKLQEEEAFGLPLERRCAMRKRL